MYKNDSPGLCAGVSFFIQDLHLLFEENKLVLMLSIKINHYDEI
jgi:hypothetical protein